MRAGTEKRRAMAFMSIILRFGQGSELLKTWIISERIEHRIEPEQCRSQRNARTKRAQRKVSIIASAKRRWRDRLLLFALPPGRKTQSKQDQLTHLSRPGSQSLRAPPVLTRRPCYQGSSQSEQDPQGGYGFPVVLSGRIPVRCVLSPSFLGSRMITSDLLRPA